MVEDNLNCKNACLAQDIFFYGSRSISVSETKVQGKRIYEVYLNAYYRDDYGSKPYTCFRGDRGAKCKAYFKEFLTFEGAKEAFRAYDYHTIINQIEDYSFNPLYSPEVYIKNFCN